MSTPDDQKNPTPEPKQPIRFLQLCKVSEHTLLALSDEGVVYRREYSEDADITIWRRLSTVTSTQLEVRPCSFPECDYLIEKLPEDWEPIAKPSCDLHRWRV